MRRKGILIAGVIALVALSGFWYLRGTPHYSLFKLSQAVRNHNPDEAFKYIDIDSVVAGFARTLMGSNPGETEEEAARRSSLRRMIAEALPGMRGSIRSSLRDAIAGKDRDKGRKGLGSIEINNLNLRKIRETPFWNLEVKRNGSTAMVHLKDNPGLKAKMVKTTSGHWQITEVILSP